MLARSGGTELGPPLDQILDLLLESAISFLEKQKLVNCPCCVHTEKRGYDWIVFKRQPDSKSYRDEEEYEVNSVDDVTDDDEFFSAEAQDAILAPASEDEKTLVEQNNPDGITESSESSEKP